MLAGENAQKLVAKSTKIKTIQLSHGVNGLTWNYKNVLRPTWFVTVE